MTYLYFVRHAEPNFDNHNDRLRELSKKGQEDRKLESYNVFTKQSEEI